MKNKFLLSVLFPIICGCTTLDTTNQVFSDFSTYSPPDTWEYKYLDLPFELFLPAKASNYKYPNKENVSVVTIGNSKPLFDWPGSFSFDIYSHTDVKNLESYLIQYCEINSIKYISIQKVNDDMKVYYLENCSEFPKTTTWPIYTADQYIVESSSGLYVVRMSLEDYKPIHGERMNYVMSHVKASE